MLNKTFLRVFRIDFLKLNLERKMGYNNNIKINIQILEIIKYK